MSLPSISDLDIEFWNRETVGKECYPFLWAICEVIGILMPMGFAY